jgi:hypothetical protein
MRTDASDTTLYKNLQAKYFWKEKYLKKTSIKKQNTRIAFFHTIIFEKSQKNEMACVFTFPNL